MTFYVVIGFCAFLLSLLGTRLAILAIRTRIHPLDVQLAKRGDKVLEAPRQGGIPFFFALIISLLIADTHYAIILALFLLAAIALLSELIEISFPIKLMVQIMSVAIPLSMSNTLVFDGALPPLVEKLLIGGVWLWFINLFTAMDRLEGIAVSEMIAVGLGVCLIIGFVGTWPHYLFTDGMIIAAAAAGFLWWNWHPAKIWLGECGTMVAGFLIFYLLWQLAANGHWFAAFILPAYYLADGIISMMSHAQREKRVCISKCEFYHQKALKHGKGRDETTRYIFGVNILLIFLATRSVLDPEIAVIYLGVAYMAVFMLLGFFAHGRPSEQAS